MVRIAARHALIVTVFWLIASSSYAQQPAQPTTGDAGKPSQAVAQAEARIEMREGLAAFDNKEYEGALKRFRRAMELVPEANLPHRHAAKALEALGRWEEALAEHQEYLRIKPDVSDASAVRERIDEIKRTQLSGLVELHCEPEPNEVLVDGTSIVPIESARKLRLARGTHRILVRAPGSVPREIEVTISNAGQTITPECMLEKAQTGLSGPAGGGGGGPFGPTPPPKETPKPWYGRWYTWAGAGALAAGGVVLGILLAGASKNPPPASEGGNHAFP